MDSDTDSLAAKTGPLIFTNVIFHHVPNKLAPALLAALVATAVGFGAIGLDLISHFGYDVRLARQTGWRDVRKAASRLAYFLARCGSLVYLTITLVYLTVPDLDCAHYAQSLGSVWLVLMLSADALFLMRVAAVWGWHRAVAVPLGIFFLVYTTVCAASDHYYGFGVQIPQSNFCAFVLNSQTKLFVASCVMGVVQDVVVLLLVTHRLIDGGLLNAHHLLRTDKATLLRHRAERKAVGEAVGEVSIAGLLLKQGVGYFVVLVTARSGLMATYLVHPEDAGIQLVATSLFGGIIPILAGFMFRQIQNQVRKGSARPHDDGRNSNNSCDDHNTASHVKSSLRMPTMLRSARTRTTAPTLDEEKCSLDTSPRLGMKTELPHHVAIMPYRNMLPTLEHDDVVRCNASDNRVALQICVDETVDVEACTVRGPERRL